jgi:hypothetical protein
MAFSSDCSFASRCLIAVAQDLHISSHIWKTFDMCFKLPSVCQVSNDYLFLLLGFDVANRWVGLELQTCLLQSWCRTTELYLFW